MKRLLLPLTVAALALVLPLSGRAESTGICGYIPESDHIAAAEIIVGGRLGQWEIVTPEPKPVVWRELIRIEMQVRDVFKGTAPGSIQVFDDHSLRAETDPYGTHRWWTSPSDCAPFSEDPEGRYAIFGLSKDDVGRYRPIPVEGYFVGPEPTGELYDQAIADLAWRGLKALPGGGGPPSASAASFSLLPTAIAATLGPLAFLAGAAFVWRRKADSG